MILTHFNLYDKCGGDLECMPEFRVKCVHEDLDVTLFPTFTGFILKRIFQLVKKKNPQTLLPFNTLSLITQKLDYIPSSNKYQ